MKYIYIIALTVVILLIVLTTGAPQNLRIGALLKRPGVHLIRNRKQSGDRLAFSKTLAEHRDTTSEIVLSVSPIVAGYSESGRSWTFFAKVVQLKDVSMYGRRGTIARVEYLREGEPQYAWAVIKIDDYYFSDSTNAIIEGQRVMLEVFGEYVSANGVNWNACPQSDEYCQYAGFIEGGFPASADYNGLTLCPSNILIYSGYAPDDWINGMLAWKIKIED